jgi:hypothetical protein
MMAKYDKNAAASPILRLIDSIPDAVIRGAPEHADEVRRILADRQIQLVFDDVAGFVFRARRSAGRNEIRGSVAGLELLWALSYAHSVLYNAVNEAREQGEAGADFSLAEHTARAAQLLQWAVLHNVAQNDTSWPSALPQPQAPGAHASVDAVLANELFFCAVAWVLHHELAHHNLGHLDTNIKNEQQEREADLAATTWLLDNAPDEALLKRGVGIVLAVLALSILELHSVPPEQKGWLRSHPKAAERVMAALEHQSIGDTNQILDFAIVSLKMHLDYAGASYEQAPTGTLRDDLSEFCVALARAHAKTAG